MSRDRKTQKDDDVLGSAHKIWLAGLGALRVAEEEGSKLFKNLVAKGEELEDRGREQLAGVRFRVEEVASRAREEAGEAWGKVGSTLDQQVTEVLRRMGVPTRDEIGTLSRRVEELTRAVEGLRQQEKAERAKKAGSAAKQVKTTTDVTDTTETVTSR